MGPFTGIRILAITAPFPPRDEGHYFTHGRRTVTGEQPLRRMPQQETFRHVNEVLEADERHIVCRYTFRPDGEFYRGHFPGPLDGIYLLLEDGGLAEQYRTMFTDAQVEWHKPVVPADTVTHQR